MSRRTGLILLPLLGLVALGLAACSGVYGSGAYGSGGYYLSGGGGASCKSLGAKMRRLYGRGKGNSRQYRRVLDAYLARGCYRR